MILAATLATVVASADPQSKRHLVYSFTVGLSSDQHQEVSMLQQGGTGDASFKGNASDKGQITVDYLGVEADGGLVVTIAETAQNGRNAGPNTCVVYPNTNLICGTGPSNPEELAIIRTLSPKFFDPTALDANRHWHTGAESAGVSIDFTAKPGATTGPMTIESTRTEKSKSGDLTSATASYTYDMARLVPTAIKEYTTTRDQSTPGQYTNYVTDITATLISDSSAKS